MSEAGSRRGRRRAVSNAAPILFVLLGLLTPSTAAGEIYECKGADGRTVYTSDPSVCPGAEPHELKAEMHTAEPSAAASRLARGRAAAGAEAAEGAGGRAAAEVPDGVVEMWRRKRPEAEAKLAELKSQAEYLHGVVRGCNRGATWYAKDQAGLKRHVSCDELKSRSAKLDQEVAKLEVYLAGGLEEECRRAGCLPGWIR